MLDFFKNIRFLLIIVLLNSSTYSQIKPDVLCDFSDVNPFDIGLTKFDASVIEHEEVDIQPDRYYDAIAKEIGEISHWHKLSSNDSVYIAVVNYSRKADDCLTGSEIRYQLSFVDDYLYKVRIIIDYSDFGKMLNQYRHFISTVIDRYDYNGEFILRDKETKEKLGEGFLATDIDYQNSISDKINETIIKYREIKNYIPKGLNDPALLGYEIEIQIVNLELTKLTSEYF